MFNFESKLSEIQAKAWGNHSVFVLYDKVLEGESYPPVDKSTTRTSKKIVNTLTYLSSDRKAKGDAG